MWHKKILYCRFQSAKDGGKYRDYYVWKKVSDVRDNKHFVAEPGSQYAYLSSERKDPILNWSNSNVREAIFQVAKNFLNMGVDGFHLPHVNELMKHQLTSQVWYFRLFVYFFRILWLEMYRNRVYSYVLLMLIYWMICACFRIQTHHIRFARWSFMTSVFRVVVFDWLIRYKDTILQGKAASIGISKLVAQLREYASSHKELEKKEIALFTFLDDMDEVRIKSGIDYASTNLTYVADNSFIKLSTVSHQFFPVYLPKLDQKRQLI